MRARTVPALLLFACTSPSDDGGDASEPDASAVETDETDTVRDTDPPDDTDLPDDTDDTDPPDDTDLPDDTDPPRSPPTTWGGGLVEISAVPFAAAGVTVRAGQAPSQPPQLGHVFLIDLDDDGVRELVVDADVFFSPGSTRTAFAFDVTGGELVLDAALTATLASLDGPLRGALDVDGDGDDDLIQGAEPPVLYRDAGGWSDDATVSGFTDFVSWGRGSWVDVDMDGWIDVVAGPEGCGKHPIVLLQTAPRRFEAMDVVDDGPSATFGWVAPLPRPTGPDALLWMHTNKCDTLPPWPGGFLVRSGADVAGRPHWAEVDLTDADALWKLDPQFAGLPYTAVMPMGALVEDLDGDGRFDIVPSLGFPTQLVLWGRADGGFDETSVMRFGNRGTYIEVPWAIAAPDLDADGTPDLGVAVGDDVTSFRVPAGESFLPRVWWGRGDRTFVDVTDVVGVDVGGSWHELAVDDLDGDGDGDLLVGGYGSRTTVYRSDIDLGRSMGVRVRGSTSSGPAIGARVAVTTDGTTRTQVVGGQIGLPVTPSVLLFGLGAAETTTVTVTWPTGVVQDVPGLAAGAVHEVVEPTVIELSEADRHLPADGTTALTVTVWPRTRTGGVDLVAGVVSLATSGTAVVVSAPTRRGDGAWLAELRAPAAAGSTRIEVSIDGQVVRVAPRVWWD